jgi:hypothetical protein
MAKHILPIIEVLRRTAVALENSVDYQWGHMGSCNCGFLAQQISQFAKNEIHAFAMQGCGDWSEQLNDYCPTSGLPMDGLITEMVAFGFDPEDLKHLERLSDGKILNALPADMKNLRHNIKSDVIKYLVVWSDLLETRFIEEIKLPIFESFPAEV